MTIEEFLKDLLESQQISPDQEAALQSHKDEVTEFLREEFGKDPEIKYAGSHAKGTMIRDQYDLDIVCYFPSTDERTLKEIHDDMAKHLQEKYVIEEKASAVRIANLKDDGASANYHVDVVPGRFIKDSDDVFLHVKYGDKERMQTNLKKHIAHITISECAEIIRLVKLWAHRSDLGIKTFVLELFVVKALEGFREKTNLKTAFLKVLQSFEENFQTTQLIDPANEANVVSKLVSSSIAERAVQAASAAMALIGESDDVEDWKVVFQESNTLGYLTQPSSQPRRLTINNPAGQYFS